MIRENDFRYQEIYRIYLYPLLYNTINLQGGKQLVNAPMPINISQDYGTYETLNNDNKYEINHQFKLYFYNYTFLQNMIL